MKKEKFQFGKWIVEYTPQDGARLERLCFDNYDLMTTVPESFKQHKPITANTKPVRFMVMMIAFLRSAFLNFQGKNGPFPITGKFAGSNGKQR